MEAFKGMQAAEFAECFHLLAEQSQDVFWIRNTDYTKQLYVNPAYETIWGRSCQSLYDSPKDWILTVVPEDRALLEKKIQEKGQATSGDVYQYTYRILRPDNTIRWVRDISFPLFDADSKCYGYVGVSKDVTKDILHEQELQQAKQRAETANQAKVDFLAMMSHELRTPLNTILGVTQILHTKNIGKEAKEYFDIIAHAGKNLLLLVNDILDFAKLEVGKLAFSHEPIDLKYLISQVIYSMQYLAKVKGVALKFDYQKNAPTLVLGDPKRIRQILINLVNNAIKFTEEGHVEITVKSSQHKSLGTVFQLTVSDTGIGIDETMLQYIFEKFSQIDSVYQRKQQGTGLGLAISKELIEKMNGTLAVQSELGSGSQFIVELPLPLQPKSAEPLPEKKKNKIKVAKSSQYDLTVLLVEDNYINQRIARIILEELGCQVEIVSTGKEVINVAGRIDHFDLVFMDIGLPDMSGFEVVRTIRSMGHVDIPIIAMTAHILERDKQQCFDAGMNGILEKPIHQEELTTTLAIWRAHKQSKNDYVLYE